MSRAATRRRLRSVMIMVRMGIRATTAARNSETSGTVRLGVSSEEVSLAEL